MGCFVAGALATLVVLAAGVLPVAAEDESEVEVTSIREQPLDLAARIKSASPPSGEVHLTVEVSAREFMALQRLAQEDRRRLLGLASSCRTRMTAVPAASSPAGGLTVFITCGR